MDNIITLLALDKDFNIIGILAYTNLQWTRKWFECGTFSVEIPIEQYNSAIRYLYTKDRREVGIVAQINYFLKDKYKSVNLSGFFLEKELDKNIVYPLGNTTNVLNAPNWTQQKGKAEAVAHAFFNAFKAISYTQNGNTITSSIDIAAGENKNRGHIAEHSRGSQNLGRKIYQILKPSRLSYRINYDLETNTKTFNVIQGRDLTQENTDHNNPVVFSTEYGNVKNINFLNSYSNYCNSFIVTAENEENNVKKVFVYAGNDRAANEEEHDDFFVVESSSESLTNYTSESEFVNALIIDGKEKVKQCNKVVSVEFDAMQGSYKYLQEFDLGDICSVVIPELDLNYNAIISSCYEVIKKGVWQMTIDLTII